MAKLYKLTTQEFTTYNKTKWGEGITHKTNGKGEMCGPGWIHAYTSPELALLLNPIHADITNPVLWECEGIIGKTDKGLKVGTTKLTTVKQIPMPQASLFQKTAFGILVAQCVYDDSKFKEWAENYLNGKDRSEAAAARAEARAAWAAAESAAEAARAARAAAESAAEAARAARAARAAKWAAAESARAEKWAAAEAARAAKWAAAESARAAKWAAARAAWAAWAAAWAAGGDKTLLDLDILAKKALLLKE